MMKTLMIMMLKVPLDVSASGLHILHSNGSLEVWPGEAGDHVYQCRVTLGEVGSLLSTPATLRSPGEKIVLNSETGKYTSTARRARDGRHQSPSANFLSSFKLKQDTLMRGFYRSVDIHYEF